MPVLFAMANPLSSFAEHIFNSEFTEIPSWVIFDEFKKEMIPQLETMIRDVYESWYLCEDEKYQIRSIDMEPFMCPFTSSNVDISASGGMEGKYSEVYQFPNELIKFLSNS